MVVINCYIELTRACCPQIAYSRFAAFKTQTFVRTISIVPSGKITQIYAQLLDGIKVCPETTPHCPPMP